MEVDSRRPYQRWPVGLLIEIGAFTSIMVLAALIALAAALIG